MERVCIYNRCSTEEESQKNALEVQAQESVEIASSFKDWLIVDQFIESQSGTTVKGRSKYQAMMDGIEQKRYTIVMIKSIDRLARNAMDWYIFLDCVLRNNVKLYIYIDNKFYTHDDALVTGIKAMLAAEFSRELSKKIKNAHRRRQMKKSGLNITLPMLGWDKVEMNVYTLNEEEAKAIREACDLIEKGYGFGRISRYMYNKGVRSKNGKIISEAGWRDIIRSTRMYGTVILHQYEYNFDLKKRVAVPEEEWIYIENAIPPIVTREYHDRLMEILDERADKCVLKGVPNKIGENDLSTKIICGECGSTYHRRSQQFSDGKKVTWACSKFVTLGRASAENPDGCNNISIVEDILRDLIVQAYRDRFGLSDTNSSSIIDETLRIIRKTFANKDNSVKINKLRKEIEKIQSNKNKAFDRLMDETLTADEYKMQTQRLNNMLERNTEELRALEAEMQDIIDYEQRLLNIKNELKETDLIDEAANEDILKKVEKVTVFLDGNVEIKFNRFKVLNIGSYGLNNSNDIEDLYTVTAKYEFVSKVDKQVREREQLVEDYVEKNEIINIKDIQEKFGLKYSTAYVSLKRLQEKGKIEFIKMVGGGFWRKVGSDVMIEGKRSLVSPDGIYDSIINYIEEHGKVTAPEIAKQFDITEYNAKDKLNVLKKQSKIYFVYDGPEGHWYLANQENMDNQIKPMKDRIEDYMRMYKEASIRVVMEALDVSYSTARVRLRELKNAGKVEYRKSGSPGGTWYWVGDADGEVN